MRHLALAVFVLTASVTAQVEHAPTVAQCQADRRLWFSQLEGESANEPMFAVLIKRGAEMEDCEQVDPDNELHYFNTRAEINAVELGRMTDFIQRHNLLKQFIEEDVAGKR